MIGIVASTNFEIDLIASELSNKKDTLIYNKIFLTGYIGNKKKIVVSISGIGKANAAHGTSMLIEKYKPEIIFNIGVAGAYPSSNLKIGSIAIAEKEIYGDEGLIIKGDFYTMDRLSLPLATINGIDYYNEFPMFIPKDLIHIPRGNFVTLSTVTGTLRQAKKIEKKFNGVCENMEGAAVAHICLFAGIPATEIRAISNIIKDRTPEPLKKIYIQKASRNCQRFLIDYLKNSDL